MSSIEPRNPRAEATTVAGQPARVLEPSPPAIATEPWFADDPTAPDGGDAVTPTTAGSITWEGLARDDPTVTAFARENWLGPYKPLPGVPVDYVSGRSDFHRLAYGVVANARKAANGKIGLRYTCGGFGTPFFGEDEQVRVQGAQLIVQRGPAAESEDITTLARAAEFLGTVVNADQAEPDTVELGEHHRPLDARAEVGLFLGDWFGFCTSVLEQTLLGASSEDDASRVQIWPGHFDPAADIGNGDTGSRASYGASPGDAGSEEPYLYVAPWGDVDSTNKYWNSDTFPGSQMTYQELLNADDQRQAALNFLRQGNDILHA